MTKNLLILAVINLAIINQVMAENPVKINQVGFTLKGKKTVITAGKSSYFFVKTAEGKKVYSSDFGPEVKDMLSGDTVKCGDFTALELPGKYYIETEKDGNSAQFEISDDVYEKPFKIAFHSFYHQRCGMEINDGSPYGHKACHLSDAEMHYTTGKDADNFDARGGWHDAGDYGKYSVNSGISTGTLLLMFERFENRMETINTGLPEKARINGLPEVLNEAKWNLDWMLKMQDKEDGGVYHKATPYMFPPMNLMPEDDKSVYFIYEKTSTATANLAAVAAIASRVFAKYDGNYSVKCLEASKKAWEYLKKNPGIVPAGGYKNPSDTKTGQYGDNEDRDERLWAASELFAATNGKEHEEYFCANYLTLGEPFSSASSWRDVKEMAMISMLVNNKKIKKDIYEEIKSSLKRHADILVQRIKDNGYRSVMLEEDYKWGSNSVALNYAINLLAAADIFNNSDYKNAASEVLDYIFGRNPFAISYVTGIGSVSVKNIHHRPSVADKNTEPWPGLLCGGPNKGRQDPELKNLPFDTPPARCYVDKEGSYAGNEIAINWNAPLCYVLAAFLPEKIQP